MSSRWLLILIAGSLVLAACASAGGSAPASEEFEIITLLPKDAIPSIDRPRFYNLSEADVEYEPNEIVIGVEFNGDARAYPVGLLSSHEIVNDMVGGHPIAVTW